MFIKELDMYFDFDEESDGKKVVKSRNKALSK